MPFAITIFISAFFLFQVQPVIARFILPWYGGSPAVWSTCMLFFQAGLLLGYVYAHLLACYARPRRQVLLHAALLAASLLFLPITPDAAMKPAGDNDPIWGIIRLLVLTVGAPYVLISSTGPLLQHWYNLRYAGKSPYRLYALSNLGSLLGLATYPFLIEPNMVLGAQTIFWSCGYLFFAGTCLWSGRSLLSANSAGPSKIHSDPSSLIAPQGIGPKECGPSKADLTLWLGLSACGSIMFLSVTSKITQDISVTPFLWVLPLSLYLGTLIIAFDNPKWYRRRIWLPAFLLSAALIAYLLQRGTRLHIATTISLYCVSMFCIVMVCHGELARGKPPANRLTFFYLMVSLGGAIGGAFASFVATKLFPAYWELQVGLCIALISVGFSLFRLCGRESGPCLAGRRRAVAMGAWSIATIALAVPLAIATVEAEGDALATRRNFYGVLRVHERHKGRLDHYRKLYSGQINHGLQLFHPAEKNRIVSYYSAHSGLGIAFRRHPKRLALSNAYRAGSQAPNLRVGVVGLGIGVIASWGLPGDIIRFYEINPEVVRLANEFFTVLKNTKAKVEVVPGDGRISLERELRERGSMQYDLLVVDAFSGDAIPVHLITREAFELYFKHLRDDGILALHISNRHLDLRPVVYALARGMDMPAIMVKKKKRPKDFIKGSSWALLTKDKRFLGHPQVLKHVTPWPEDIRDDIIWTDDYSSLLKILK